MRKLERMHPAVGFLYLLGVLGITAFAGSPVVVLESLAGAALLAALSGRLRGIGWTVPIAFTAALANFLFVHNGATALFFVGDMAFTLEALAYGAFTGVMLAAVCLWGNNAVRYVTSDKYIWLFGSILPAAGLVLSCAIRFIPMFVRRTREFIAVQRCTTARGYLRAFSASVGYSAEQAMDSALSMRARGYGTARRTSFSLYRFTGGTAAALAVTVFLGAGCAALGILVLSGGVRNTHAAAGYPAVLRIRGVLPAALRGGRTGECAVRPGTWAEFCQGKGEINGQYMERYVQRGESRAE